MPLKARLLTTTLLILVLPMGQLQAAPKAAKPKAKPPAAAKPPPGPTYPPPMAQFPCRPGATPPLLPATVAAAPDEKKPGRLSAGFGAAKKVLGGVSDKTMSVVADKFSISGEDGVFLCGDKVRQKLVDRLAAQTKLAAKIAAQTPGKPLTDQSSLGLAAFADSRGALRPELFSMPETQARLQSIVNRIASAWPYPNAPRPKVLVNAGLKFNAEATADGTIIVWLGVFAPPSDGTANNMKDTDLYWLLAHEYSHIALGHADKADTIFSQGQMLNSVATAYMNSAQLTSSLQYGESGTTDPELGGRIRVAKQMHENLRFISKSIIDPAWGRMNEDEADTAGTDLTASLGYYPRFSYIAQRFETSDKRWEDRMKDAQALVGKRIQVAVSDPKFKAAMDSGDMGAALGSVGESLKKGVYDAGRQWVIDFLTRDHRSTKAREEGLDRYRTAAYATLELPKGATKEESSAILDSAEVRDALLASGEVEACQDSLNAGDVPAAQAHIRKALGTRFAREAYVRFWAARVALAAGDRPGAISQLELARSAPSVSPVAYRELAKLYTQSGQIPKASVIIAEGRQKTGDSDYFLPEDVRIAARSPDKAVLGPLMQRCRAVKREAIAYDCTQALTEIEWDKLSPAQRKVAMGYAVWGDVSLKDKKK